MLEGICDLLFLEGEKWHLVDFKTDEDSSRRSVQYERQIQRYGHAVSQLNWVTGFVSPAFHMTVRERDHKSHDEIADVSPMHLTGGQ